MDRVPGDRADIRVPPEDGSIAQALTELDGKVADWVAAMRAAEARLTEMSTGSRRQAETADRSERDQPTPAGVDSELRVVAAEPEADAGEAGVEPTSSETGPALAVAQAEQETVEEIEAARGSVMTATAEPVAEEPEAETAPDPDQDGSEDADAVLLDTLDAETAKAIRVMRRLAPVKRSVRELLSEYEAKKASGQTVQPKKKSWFLRKR